MMLPEAEVTHAWFARVCRFLGWGQDAVGPVRPLPTRDDFARHMADLQASCDTVEAARGELWTKAGLPGHLALQFHPKEVWQRWRREGGNGAHVVCAQGRLRWGRQCVHTRGAAGQVLIVCARCQALCTRCGIVQGASAGSMGSVHWRRCVSASAGGAGGHVYVRVCVRVLPAMVPCPGHGPGRGGA
jgi:hypothetical protein